jgi:hypothetical protein
MHILASGPEWQADYFGHAFHPEFKILPPIPKKLTVWIKGIALPSKAFDTVDNSRLIQRLSSIGLDQAARNRFKNDFTDRTQCIATDGVNSGFLNITKGVPQGLILGPVLFTVYINNIDLSANNCNLHLYADDSVVYAIATTVDHTLSGLQSAFIVLQK